MVVTTYMHHVEQNHFPYNNHYRNLLATGFWEFVRQGVIRTSFLVLGLVPEGSYNCSDCKQDRISKPKIGLKALCEEL